MHVNCSAKTLFEQDAISKYKPRLHWQHIKTYMYVRRNRIMNEQDTDRTFIWVSIMLIVGLFYEKYNAIKHWTEM